jgi:hypothetical protein
MNPARTDTAGRFGSLASQIWSLFLRPLQSARLAAAAEACQNGRAVKKNFPSSHNDPGNRSVSARSPTFLLQNGHPTALVPSLAPAAKRSACLSRRHVVPADASRFGLAEPMSNETLKAAAQDR